MSDHAAPADSSAAPISDFDREEVAEFQRTDGDAIKVIGKMLVGFFAYSLIVAILVGLWTWQTYKVDSPTPAEAEPAIPAPPH